MKNRRQCNGADPPILFASEERTPRYERLSRGTDSQRRRHRSWWLGEDLAGGRRALRLGRRHIASARWTTAPRSPTSDPDEIKRHMSINLTVVPVEWSDDKINFLDTPGYADFVGEVMAGLRVADAALVVVSAEKGVEVGTELAWSTPTSYRPATHRLHQQARPRKHELRPRARIAAQPLWRQRRPADHPHRRAGQLLRRDRSRLRQGVQLLRRQGHRRRDSRRHGRRSAALPRAAGGDRRRERRRPDGEVSRGRGDQRRRAAPRHQAGRRCGARSFPCWRARRRRTSASSRCSTR